MSLFGVMLLTLAATAQQPAGTAPMPAQILNAKAVFISNTGSIPYNISGGSNRLYVSFYQQMQAAGSFRIVNDPKKADLTLEPRYFSTLNFLNTPEVQLSIYDPATHVLLWTLNQSIEPCALRKACDRNLDSALTSLAMQVMQLRSQAWVGVN